jgi:hypothetical protein
MDDGAPSTLSVGFAIDTQDSFSELLQLQSVMGSTEAKVVADAANMERATTGMLNLGRPITRRPRPARRWTPSLGVRSKPSA